MIGPPNPTGIEWDWITIWMNYDNSAAWSEAIVAWFPNLICVVAFGKTAMGGTSARSIGKYRFHRVKTAFELSINQYCRSKNGKLISRVQCMFF